MEVEIIVKWTNELTDEDICNFSSVFDGVYGNFNREVFKKKYLHNIYGPSLIIEAFLLDKCVGIQAFLRNDLNGIKAYQSGDSAVLAECRGAGVFQKMVKAGVEVIKNDAFIYGFPNMNSLPSFMRMNWKELYHFRYNVLLTRKQLMGYVELNADYASWISEGNKSVFTVRRFGNNYLVRKEKNFVYIVYAKIHSDDASKFSRKCLPILFVHDPNGRIGNGVRCIAFNGEGKVDIHKMDVLIDA